MDNNLVSGCCGKVGPQCSNNLLFSETTKFEFFMFGADKHV